MNDDFRNPFADYGNIVRGDRFIGRKDELKVIHNRVLRPVEPANLAIIGEPRIGKSSLVYKAVLDNKDSLIQRKIIPIWINLGTYDKVPSFFRSLVSTCRNELQELDLLSETISLAADKALLDTLSWIEGYCKIQKFFQKVRQSGIRVLIILDEFDHARHLFRGEVSAFQGLRELSYRPEWRIAYITTSRRSIREIEVQTGAISNFDGIFHKCYLSMFNGNDLEDYFNKFLQTGIELDNAQKEKILFYCGGHPYLMEIMAFDTVEMYREMHFVDIDRIAQANAQSFVDQYDRIISLLKEDGSLDKLLQILFGPVMNVKQTDVDEFLRYGLIIANTDNTYSAYSPYFYSYLHLIERDIDLWPLWNKTEKAARNLITLVMRQKYGDH